MGLREPHQHSEKVWQSSIQLLFCGNWSTNDAPCSELAYTVVNELLAILYYWTGLKSCSPPFSRTDTLPFLNRAFRKKPTLPHSWKLLFQTACKITSCRCIVTEPVSTKKASVYYWQKKIPLSVYHTIVQWFNSKLELDMPKYLNVKK